MMDSILMTTNNFIHTQCYWCQKTLDNVFYLTDNRESIWKLQVIRVNISLSPYADIREFKVACCAKAFISLFTTLDLIEVRKLCLHSFSFSGVKKDLFDTSVG